MDRIVFDVPRWSILLHRDARGLPWGSAADLPERKLEDEIFERLYAGAAEPLDQRYVDSALAGWARTVHGTCDALPAFQRLQAECRGDATAAGAAVEALLDTLKPKCDDPAQLRRALRAGCQRASAAVAEALEATEGMEQVAFGSVAGTGHVVGETRLGGAARTLSQRIRDDHRLRRIALLAGRFKRIAAAKRRQRVKHGADEVADVEQGAELERLLPAELARLTRPRLRLLLLRDLSERRALQYQLIGTETLGKGPLVVCLDKSGSMDGPPDIWATAVALALLDVAHRERRPFAMLSFDEGTKYKVVVKPGDLLPEAAVFVGCGGGTEIANVLDEALQIIGGNLGALRKADVVLITDGGSSTDRAAALRARASQLGVTILGVGIGVTVESLLPWCDEAQAVTDLERIDDATASRLFDRE